jgi:hypothetical protein
MERFIGAKLTKMKYLPADADQTGNDVIQNQ